MTRNWSEEELRTRYRELEEERSQLKLARQLENERLEQEKRNVPWYKRRDRETAILRELSSGTSFTQRENEIMDDMIAIRNELKFRGL